VVFEAIAKAAEIIVHARCPLASSPQKASSSRFNLHIPEIEPVRSSLQRWRRSLHVPLRLDVYYQHSDPNRRELLERWCIEFTPSPHQHFGAECASPDPIVQLRHVCKKIVIWLRSLYSIARLLPAHQLYASQNLTYDIHVLEEWQDLPQFKHDTLPPVPTPYGPLQWKVWYAPSIRRFLPTRKTQPIPMNVTRPNHIPVPPPIAKSAPVDYYQMPFRRQQHHHYHHHGVPTSNHHRWHSTVEETHPSNNNQRPVYARSSSMENSPSALSLALLAEEGSLLEKKRRAALHHPPPVESSSYGYAYNNTPPTTLNISSSPFSANTHMPPLSSTPPLFGGHSNAAAAAAAAAASPMIPPRQKHHMTPPFGPLPLVLSEPDVHQQMREEPSSLDLLHSSPFLKSVASFSESEVLKHSVVIPPAEEEDMPFAVDEFLQESAVEQLAHQCVTASKLQLFDQPDDSLPNEDLVSSLADQLAEFKSFGASLHISTTSNSQYSKNSNEGSTSSTLLSMRT
jgi:hypothetical protein